MWSLFPASLLPILLLSACFRLSPDERESAWDRDGDGHAAAPEGDDCDDGDATVHPDATETCNGRDDDCDGSTDDDDPDVTDPGTWYRDADGDGWGDGTTARPACAPTSDEVDRAGDCDDGDPAFHPEADETDCTDPADYDCDGQVAWVDGDGDGTAACVDCDDGDPTRQTDTAWYADLDGDGAGAGEAVVDCAPPPGHVATSDDCDDDDYTTFPTAPELCDGVDNDCNGHVDDEVEAVPWYVDADDDAWGAALDPVSACSQPDGYVYRPGDCDDTLPSVHPGAPETCSGIDDDCDGYVDGVDEDMAGDATWYRDADGDGWGLATETTEACSQGDGWVRVSGDCDDTTAAARPGAPEVCDGLDDDCDGLVDDADPDVLGVPTWYADADGDGYGDPATSTVTCDAPTGFVADTTDCDDTEATVSPAGFETCDGIDQDCDGAVDDDATDAGTWYADGDGDGYGDAATSTVTCDPPPGFVTDATDCDDDDATVSPAGTETCDDRDEDCDGAVDDDAIDAGTWYPDADGDTFGDAATPTVTCDAPTGFVADATDCDDDDATVSPAGTETCDDRDEDCDGAVDDDATDAGTWYPDADGDTFGDAATPTLACDAPPGFVADATDCDDDDATVSPAGTETCDDRDEDCDGAVDNDAIDAGTWYADADGDGYGASSPTTVACDAPTGYAAVAGDCADWDATRNPDQFEYDDGVDEDCDGSSYDHDLSTADVILAGEAAGDVFAQALAIAGDLDDDGYPDLVVGARANDTVAEDAGAVYVYGRVVPGSTPTPSATLYGESSWDSGGNSVTPAGDVNLDGQHDLLVGAYHTGPTSTSTDEQGTVYLVHGPLSGTMSLADADLAMEGVSDIGLTGIWSSPMADLTGDGLPEILVGAYNEWSPSGAKYAGAAYLVRGGQSGTLSLAAADAAWYGTYSIGVGTRVADGGDLDGDGVHDVVIGTYCDYLDHAQQGSVSILFDPLNGITDLAAARDVVLWPESGYGHFGVAVDTQVDANGDGYDDLLVGADGPPPYPPYLSAAYLFYGPFTSSDTRMRGEDARLDGDDYGQHTGDAVVFAGDFDGDGEEDLFVGGRGETTLEGGWAWLVPGPVHGVLEINDEATVVLHGPEEGDWAGSPLDAGDLDLDGSPDLVIGAFYSDRSGVDAGAAYVLFGSGN